MDKKFDHRRASSYDTNLEKIKKKIDEIKIDKDVAQNLKLERVSDFYRYWDSMSSLSFNNILWLLFILKYKVLSRLNILVQTSSFILWY